MTEPFSDRVKAPIQQWWRNPLQGAVERVLLVERDDLVFVGEQNVDMMLDQIEKVGAVAIDAERVRQTQRDQASGLMGNPRGLAEGLLGRRPIPQIAFQVGHPRRLDRCLVDVGGSQLGACAEKGLHRAVRVGCHENQAAPGWCAAVGGFRREADAERGDVMAEDRAELVVADLADERPFAAERGESGDGVGRRAAGDRDRWTHLVVERSGRIGVDQGHRPPVEAEALDDVVVGMADHVDNRIADPDNVVMGRRHWRGAP